MMSLPLAVEFHGEPAKALEITITDQILAEAGAGHLQHKGRCEQFSVLKESPQVTAECFTVNDGHIISIQAADCHNHRQRLTVGLNGHVGHNQGQGAGGRLGMAADCGGLRGEPRHWTGQTPRTN